MDVRHYFAVVSCLFFISHMAAAQEVPEAQPETVRIYALLLSGKDSATLKPISRIEETPFGISCISFREIECVRENGQVHLFANDAQLHFRGLTKHAERIEMRLGDNGIQFDGGWQMMPSNAEESLLYKKHYAGQLAAIRAATADRWILSDQRQIFRDQLLRTSNAFFPHER